MTCWTHMNHPNRQDVNAIIYELFSPISSTAASLPEDRHVRAVRAVGVDTLAQRFREWLNVTALRFTTSLSLHTHRHAIEPRCN